MSELNWNELWDEAEQRYRVMTRDGMKVRIYTTNGSDPCYPVVGERRRDGCGWAVDKWKIGGEWRGVGDDHSFNLIPEPRVVRMWGNIYRHSGGLYGIGGLFESEAKARERIHTHDPCIATVPVEWEE